MRFAPIILILFACNTPSFVSLPEQAAEPGVAECQKQGDGDIYLSCPDVSFPETTCPDPVIQNNIQPANVEVSCPEPVINNPVTIQVDPAQIGVGNGGGRSRAVLYIAAGDSLNSIQNGGSPSVYRIVNGIYSPDDPVNGHVCGTPGPTRNSWDLTDCCPPGFTPVGFDDRSSVYVGVKNLVCLED
jgi:hypothetical protein